MKLNRNRILGHVLVPETDDLHYIIFPLFKNFFQYPMETYGYALIFSMTGYIGVKLVLTMVKTFGALVAVTGWWNFLICDPEMNVGCPPLVRKGSAFFSLFACFSPVKTFFIQKTLLPLSNFNLFQLLHAQSLDAVYWLYLLVILWSKLIKSSHFYKCYL